MDKEQLAQAFTVIAQKQDEMNKAVNPEWAKAGYDWPRALWTEIGEAMGYVNWAWWKKGPQVPEGVNKYHLYLELADSLHFGVSIYLAEALKSFGDAILAYRSIGGELAHQRDQGVAPNYTIEGTKLADLLEGVARDAIGYGQFDAPGFFAACRLAGLSTPTLIAYYHGKSVLNHFRQEHGYKQGTYRKMWAGDLGNHEDNLYLADLIETYSKTHSEEGLLKAIQKGSFENHIRMNLTLIYNQLPPERRQS